MLKNHVFNLITNNFQFSPTAGQKIVIDILSDFIVQNNENEIIIIKGYAGTGKTSLISAFIKALGEIKIKSFLLAPTGRAAKILMNYSEKNAYTIHKKIYRQKSSKDGFGEFSLDKNLHKNTCFIVDEASMISNSSLDYSIFGSGKLLDDLIYYVYSGERCRLILFGDTAQLPPVKLELSPALDQAKLEEYDLIVKETELTEVVRHESHSGILFNATKIRENISLDIFQIEFKLNNFSDIIRLNGSELIESMEDSINKYGINDVVVICRSNKRANQYNQGIRNKILYREDEITTGDLLMVVKNNYYWLEENEQIDFVANGDIVEIVKIHGYEEQYNLRFANVTIRFLDYKDVEVKVKIILNTLTIDTASLPSERNKELFYSILDDYNDIKLKKKRYQKVREDKYFNALQVKFAYALTCHKSQGGQWKVVYVDQGYLSDDMINKEYLRWLYTAITRATEKLYLVNFKDDFFVNNF